MTSLNAIKQVRSIKHRIQSQEVQADLMSLSQNVVVTNIAQAVEHTFINTTTPSS